MQEHLHTGPTAFIFAGVSALIFLNLWRIIAAYLADNPKTETLGKMMGGLITFTAETETV